MILLFDQINLQIFEKRVQVDWKSKSREKYSRRRISNKALDWCVQELQYKAKTFDEGVGAIIVFNGDVVKSDTVVPKSLLTTFKAAASAFENADISEDWLNVTHRSLVDPFLCPLVFGRTRALPDTLVPVDEPAEHYGEGDIISIPSQGDTTIKCDEALIFWDKETLPEPYSRKFQWLPSDVDISGNGGSVK